MQNLCTLRFMAIAAMLLCTSCFQASIFNTCNCTDNTQEFKKAKIIIHQQSSGGIADASIFGAAFETIIVNQGFITKPSDSLITCKTKRYGTSDDYLIFEIYDFKTDPFVDFEFVVKSENTNKVYYKGMFNNNISIKVSEKTRLKLSAQKLADKLIEKSII